MGKNAAHGQGSGASPGAAAAADGSAAGGARERLGDVTRPEWHARRAAATDAGEPPLPGASLLSAALADELAEVRQALLRLEQYNQRQESSAREESRQREQQLAAAEAAAAASRQQAKTAVEEADAARQQAKAAGQDADTARQQALRHRLRLLLGRLRLLLLSRLLAVLLASCLLLLLRIVPVRHRLAAAHRRRRPHGDPICVTGPNQRNLTRAAWGVRRRLLMLLKLLLLLLLLARRRVLPHGPCMPPCIPCMAAMACIGCSPGGGGAIPSISGSLGSDAAGPLVTEENAHRSLLVVRGPEWLRQCGQPCKPCEGRGGDNGEVGMLERPGVYPDEWVVYWESGEMSLSRVGARGRDDLHLYQSKEGKSALRDWQRTGNEPATNRQRTGNEPGVARVFAISVGVQPVQPLILSTVTVTQCEP
ncbi:hypothetical protein TSOC_005949 [Tetrabaena socialis]|uniref:MIB/HERC2 domain-containing protein n=1 Tax=Tetrabaena socialis TaxID=47790 RepID=A0A2J8A501_9CHLO|nr:hypothetical protein TSOC_005949 [Tetrabaena socialis]|eukprot:PNH07587.1 hypothetical protein TSOC_005949 [Tetrabaena socialis]